MIDETFIEKIVEIARPALVTARDREYSTGQLHNLPLPHEPEFPGFAVQCLRSFGTFIASGIDTAGYSGKMQIVATFNSVTLLGPPEGVNRKRAILLKAVADLPRILAIDEYLNAEQFRIELTTKFKDSPDRTAVLALLARITDSHVKESTDDGISQTVTVRSGIAGRAEAPVPSPVTLKPNRTFAEIEQPDCTFLFRMKSAAESNGLPLITLAEVTTPWKRLCAERLTAWLENEAALKGIPILA